MSAYDAVAPSFDRDRALPEGVAEAIRASVLDAVDRAQPRLLDLGAGTGRIGWPFVAAGDDYVGADLSLGMLRAFRGRAEAARHVPQLVQADGHRLPFGGASFDAVMLIQVFGGMQGWREFIDEARRVLRAGGALIVGRGVGPADGVDGRMKERLDAILTEIGIAPRAKNPRDDVQRWLGGRAQDAKRIVATAWTAPRSPRRFLERHRGAARFATLPDSVKDEALQRLGRWAHATFGSLDAETREQFEFELQVFKFEGAIA
jgi:SAM-dependent methyltransferase